MDLISYDDGVGVNVPVAKGQIEEMFGFSESLGLGSFLKGERRSPQGEQGTAEAI